MENKLVEKLDMESYQKKKCKWSLIKDPNVEDPHIHTQSVPRKKIYNNILEAIHQSPMVKLNKIPASEGVVCEVLAKCEYFLPGGSIKDRIAKRMVEDAEKKGTIKPGHTIIEATSGNTGIGLALVGAVKGYNVLITLPEKMSQEKVDVLSALGADIIRTPTEAGFADIDSHIGVARQKQMELDNSVILDQYCNPSNALAHYDETAEEIWEQCDGKLDYVVLAAGTGGTLTGIGRKLKEKNPNIKIIGVDPKGSILAYPDELNTESRSYKIEGIGYDFIPKNCYRTEIVDQWIKTEDKESFEYARRLIREEGLFVGGSSGCCMWAAMQIAKTLPADKRVVCIFVDSLRNYITKFISDDWLLENGFLEQEIYDKKYINNTKTNLFGDSSKVSDLDLKVVFPVKSDVTVQDCLKQFKDQNTDYLPVENTKSELMGVITSRQLTNFLTSYRLNMSQPITKSIIKEFKKVLMTDSLKYLSKSFNRHSHILVHSREENVDTYRVANHCDLLNFYMKSQ